MNNNRSMALAFAGLLAAAVAGAAAPAFAQQPAAASADAAAMTAGEVKKVDKQAGRVTLQHGDIKNLNMPAMTMAFAVKDKSLLDKVKPGDKVRFAAVDDNGRLTVTAIQPAK